MSWEVVDVDPSDQVSFDAWYDVYAAAELHARDDLPTAWQRDERRASLLERGSRARFVAVSGVVDGRAVSSGLLYLPLLDNLDRAELSVHVHPGARRRGHGTALLEHLERLARSHERRVLVGEAYYGLSTGPDGAGAPGPEFARARGYALGLAEVQRVLRLPVELEVLDRLAGEAARHHTAYTLVSWVGPVPDDLLAGWAELTSSLSTEAPLGDLAMDREAASAEAVREGEALLARQGRTKLNSAALDAAGVPVAYSDLVTTVHEPGRAYQWGTLVHPDHRGHRLGIAVKVANLRLLQRERPDIDHVVTYNAEVNQHMIGVNELLGFRAVGRMGSFQKHLG